MLPDVDGLELCAKLRERLYCPIIFISCIDDEDTIVQALEMGGDDYLTKPFPLTARCFRPKLRPTSGGHICPAGARTPAGDWNTLSLPLTWTVTQLSARGERSPFPHGVPRADVFCRPSRQGCYPWTSSMRTSGRRTALGMCALLLYTYTICVKSWNPSWVRPGPLKICGVRDISLTRMGQKQGKMIHKYPDKAVFRGAGRKNKIYINFWGPEGPPYLMLP